MVNLDVIYNDRPQNDLLDHAIEDVVGFTSSGAGSGFGGRELVFDFDTRYNAEVAACNLEVKFPFLTFDVRS